MRRIAFGSLNTGKLTPALEKLFLEVGLEVSEIKTLYEVEMYLPPRSAWPEVTHKGKRVAQWKTESARRGAAR